MQILLVTPFFGPGPGGSARLLQEIAEYLQQQGHFVRVLTYAAASEKDGRHFDQTQKYAVDRVRPLRLPVSSSLGMAVRLLALQRQTRFDIVLCGVAYPSAILAYLASLLTRVPYVIYSHGEDVTVHRDSPRKAMLLRRTLQRASAIMTNSRFTKAEVESLEVPATKVFWVPPGIDPEPYENTLPEAVAVLRKRWGLEGKRVILTLARLAPRKGHDSIVRALPELCKHVPNLHYLIVGHGDPAVLQELAAKGGVSDRITFVAHVPDSELPALYHLCDVYAMPSRWDTTRNEVEGFGFCYLEAAASGKPSLAGSSGGCKDAVEDNITGLITDPTSQDAITQALATLLIDHDKASAMGKAGQRRVRMKFNKGNCLQQIEQILLHNASS